MAPIEQAVSVVVIDDSDADALLIQIAAKRSRVPARFTHFSDGQTALDHLNNTMTTLPDIILLDLNMPGLSGLEVLEVIRKTPRLQTLTVLILSSSEDESDMARGYDLDVNAYLVKPVGMRGFEHVVDVLDEYWFSHVLPRPQQAR